MFGTLLVQLPVVGGHTGGELHIKHEGRRLKWRTAPTGKASPTEASSKPGTVELSYAAFYADCEHQLMPVQSGLRVVLSYNLVHTGPRRGVHGLGLSAEHMQGLAAAVRAWEETPMAEARGHLLALPLEHQYTEFNLSFGGLKGRDHTRVQALLGCGLLEVRLGLLHKHVRGNVSYACLRAAEERRERYDGYGYDSADEESDQADDDEDEDVCMSDVISEGCSVPCWLRPDEARGGGEGGGTADASHSAGASEEGGSTSSEGSSAASSEGGSGARSEGGDGTSSRGGGGISGGGGSGISSDQGGDASGGGGDGGDAAYSNGGGALGSVGGGARGSGGGGARRPILLGSASDISNGSDRPGLCSASQVGADDSDSGELVLRSASQVGVDDNSSDGDSADSGDSDSQDGPSGRVPDSIRDLYGTDLLELLEERVLGNTGIFFDDPDERQVTPYLGNAAPQVAFEYRAAIAVFWPRNRAAAVACGLGFGAGLMRLERLIKAGGDPSDAVQMLEALVELEEGGGGKVLDRVDWSPGPEELLKVLTSPAARAMTGMAAPAAAAAARYVAAAGPKLRKKPPQHAWAAALADAAAKLGAPVFDEAVVGFVAACACSHLEVCGQLATSAALPQRLRPGVCDSLLDALLAPTAFAQLPAPDLCRVAALVTHPRHHRRLRARAAAFADAVLARSDRQDVLREVLGSLMNGAIMNGEEQRKQQQLQPHVERLARERLRELEEATAGGEPVLSWEQPSARLPAYPQIQAFLRGPQQSACFSHGFRNIAEAREFATTVFGTLGRLVWRNGYCVTVEAGGAGRNAYIRVTKGTAPYDRALAKWRADAAERSRVRQLLGLEPPPPPAPAPPPPAAAGARAAGAAAPGGWAAAPAAATAPKRAAAPALGHVPASKRAAAPAQAPAPARAAAAPAAGPGPGPALAGHRLQLPNGGAAAAGGNGGAPVAAAALAAPAPAAAAGAPAPSSHVAMQQQIWAMHVQLREQYAQAMGAGACGGTGPGAGAGAGMSAAPSGTAGGAAMGPAAGQPAGAGSGGPVQQRALMPLQPQQAYVAQPPLGLAQWQQQPGWAGMPYGA
ncbi:hypothetical protein HYH03_011959 [Edaphochlamys debaryana]|uniref:Prolyl 4-hydroxylase alpha subunit Fe(2+) 2OG dioxygenase domain-containing protein n=1 Tax=Edaphochlamys debaryana TaxID=47281 RepID=A0A836BUY8_9CHLO|nr:hypothetical protein HYH03_011959 [Edaphochlamys debaryana]|eukprot:KAG2489507.1 hypothetical protein HYH03_011959 [Edaphochlamys debaryana]